MIGGKAQAALFVGERIEYQVEVDGQGVIMIYGERHKPVDEGSKVWLKFGPTATAPGRRTGRTKKNKRWVYRDTPLR